MRAQAHLKSRVSSRVSNQQVVFELKNRVVIALNKVADRDTYQLGVEELGKIVEGLTPDGVAPFLSCILDSDSEHKTAVRKECIRLMGVLAAFHEDHIGLHLGKIVASVVKRLKDPDSAVRDACVETMGVLASRLSSGEDESGRVFVALVKPLFEVLGEKNKQVQSGSALCLARVIDNSNDPPSSILRRMLTRTVKLLKNPHFMAKPAVIELNRSIIQAGGAPTQSTLSAAMTSIQDGLKNSDWTTRKAASVALVEIASSGGSYYGSFKSSCICSLESCRFDKVKPVRDTVLQALHLWRSIIGPDTSEPSETGSSIKEIFCGDISTASESARKDFKHPKVGNNSVQKRSPLALRKDGQKSAEYYQSSKENDWQIEIAVPKTHNPYLADAQNEESESSSVTKTFERTSTDITCTQYIGYEYMTLDDKQECSAVSNLVSDNIETKLVAASRNGLVKDTLVKTVGANQRFADEEISREEQSYFIKRQDRESLDSTVTMLSSQTMNTCCLRTANEMVAIRKQLLEMENKQSDLLDLLKVFTTNTMESLSMIQLKVAGLEDVVDKMAQQLVHGGVYSDLSTAKLLKSSTVASPRLSICTLRPSVDIHNRQPLLPKKSNELCEEKTVSRSKLSCSSKQGEVDMWKDPIVKESKNPAGKGIHKTTGQGARVSHCQTRKSDAAFTTSARYASEVKNSPWKIVKDHLSKGDLDSAYVEALHSGDELVLIELLDKTGPVLERLSQKTANDILSTLASYFLEQRFMNSMIPWLQQIVDLCTIHGPNCLVVSAKARREFLYAIQEAVNVEFSNSAERRSMTQLVMKIHQIWGKCS